MATHTAGTLDPVRMGHIKEIILAKFGGRRRSAVDREAIWGKCKIAIGQKCKDEDEDSHSHPQASEGKHIHVESTPLKSSHPFIHFIVTCLILPTPQNTMKTKIRRLYGGQGFDLKQLQRTCRAVCQQ